MKDLVIIGVGGFGKEVAWLVERINKVKKEWNLLGFLDDEKKIMGNIYEDYKILGTTAWLKDNKEVYAVCAIGSAKTRKKVISNIHTAKFATLVDPSAIFSETVIFGEGTIVCADSILTVDIKIGKHNIINLDCTIGHDTKLNDFVTLYPSVNVSGNTLLNECVEIGTGSQIIQNLSVGENSIVGAGSVVTKNIPSNTLAVGVPANVIKSL